jgi:hypothetical protein
MALTNQPPAYHGRGVTGTEAENISARALALSPLLQCQPAAFPSKAISRSGPKGPNAGNAFGVRFPIRRKTVIAHAKQGGDPARLAVPAS